VAGDGSSLIAAGPFAVWIQLQGAPPAPAEFTAHGPATIVIPASAMSGTAAREYQETSAWAPAIVRVHAGEARRIGLG